MFFKAATILMVAHAVASPLDGPQIQKRQCPNIHVFGARETTVASGYGSSITVVNDILDYYSGSTAEAINYPACGGQASCGGVSYAESVLEGVAAVASQVNAFNNECPDTILVLVGYSQGGQIIDDAYCGGGDTGEGLTSTATPIQASALEQIAAVIFMGNPRYIYGLSYEVGTCTAEGFDPRPSGFVCPYASNIQSYCDSPDPYCCNGDDASVHEGYGAEYGSAAFQFIQESISAL